MTMKRLFSRLIMLNLASLTCFMIFASPVRAQQVGDAYILFNVSNGEFRMNPGHLVPGSAGVNSFGVEMDPALGLLSTDVNDYYFPSGSWPLFFPQTGANPGNAFGSAFQTWSEPNVTGGGDSISANNLVIGSPWVVQTGGSTGSTGAAIPGTVAVYASAIPGYEGTPEFSFGFFGPTDLTLEQGLTALGAVEQGGFANGNRVYSMNNVTGTQFFRIYTVVPEPASATLILLGSGVIALTRRARHRAAIAG